MPRFRLLVVAALAIVVLASCDEAEPPAAAELAGTSITDQQVTDAADLFRFLAGVGQQPCAPSDAEGDTEAAACNRLALTNLIQFTVTNGYAGENEIEAVAEEVDGAVDQIEQQLGTDAFEQQLTDNGTTREELRGLARDFSVLRQVATAITEDELGADEIRQRYEEDIASYSIVQVDHVLVETEEEAQEVYDEVTAPGATREDFLAIAGERSIDPGAAENSGSLGSAAASTYAPEFANAALALEEGEISEPVETEFGWHVIRLEDAEVTPLADARQQIVEQAAAEYFPEWLRGELTDLEVNPRYGRFNPETLTVERVSSTEPDASPTATDGPVNVPASP
jgi:foldase protein PrsA